jgi:hypothetical protein
MSLIAIIVMGLLSGYINIWSAVKFNDTLDKRINSLLLSVVIDVIMLILFTWIGSGSMFTSFLIAKYAFLSIINFDETLRQ